MTDKPLDEMARKVIGLAEKATGGFEARALFAQCAYTHAPAIARSYLEARALLEKVHAWMDKADVRETRGNDDGCDYLNDGGFSDAADLMTEIEASLHPQPDTTGREGDGK